MTPEPAVQTHDDAPPATNKHDTTDGAITAPCVTINRPSSELYAFWRHLPNLVTFMENVERIDQIGEDRSHWTVKAPAGATVEWTATITEDRPGELIAWQSDPDAEVPNSGRIEFRDAGARGTVVTATIVYDPPGGTIGKIVAKVLQREPAIQARRDLRRFKQLMETGEVATGARNRRLFEEGKN
jgi:uncharacterized membrane protein